MRDHHVEFERRGARVVAVGQGTGDEAAQICGGLGVPFACLGDPGRRAYRAFGLARASWWDVTLGPFVDDPKLAFDRIRRASLKGSRMPHSDVLQLPGVAIVDGEGVVAHLHRAAKTDDLPDAAAVLAQLDRLPRVAAAPGAPRGGPRT